MTNGSVSAWNQNTLDEKSQSVLFLCKKDKRLAKVIQMVGPITFNFYAENPYSFLIHEVIEQMLSVKAGKKIYERLENLCFGHITPKAVINLSDQEIRGTGTSFAKIRCIRTVTEAVLSGDLDFNKLKTESDENVIKTLTKIPGIGKWTAKMFLLFVLNREDVLPFEDAAFLQTYRWLYKTKDCSEATVTKKCKKWKPYSSIGARYFYRALDLGLTNEAFHLFKKED